MLWDGVENSRGQYTTTPPLLACGIESTVRFWWRYLGGLILQGLVCQVVKCLWPCKAIDRETFYHIWIWYLGQSLMVCPSSFFLCNSKIVQLNNFLDDFRGHLNTRPAKAITHRLLCQLRCTPTLNMQFYMAISVNPVCFVIAIIETVFNHWLVSLYLKCIIPQCRHKKLE